MIVATLVSVVGALAATLAANKLAESTFYDPTGRVADRILFVLAALVLVFVSRNNLAPSPGALWPFALIDGAIGFSSSLFTVTIIRSMTRWWARRQIETALRSQRLSPSFYHKGPSHPYDQN